MDYLFLTEEDRARLFNFEEEDSYSSFLFDEAEKTNPKEIKALKEAGQPQQQQQVMASAVTTSNPTLDTAITNTNTITNHSLSSHSTMSTTMDIVFHSHCLAKGVRCSMKLYSDVLKGKQIKIGNQNPTSSFTYSIFWKKHPKSSESFPLPFCCADCGLECIEFRCSSVTFSKDGKCQVPITFWCSPSHDKRQKTTVLILKIEITYNNIHVQGQVPIPFKKRPKSQISLESEQKNPIKFHQQISILKNTVQSINKFVESLPERNTTEKSSPKRCSSLLLAETEKRNPKKRKILEKGETEQQRQQHQHQHQQQQQSIINTTTTPHTTFTTYPLEIPHTTTNTTTTSPTYTPYATYMPYIPSTYPPDYTFPSYIPPEMFSLFFGSD